MKKASLDLLVIQLRIAIAALILVLITLIVFSFKKTNSQGARPAEQGYSINTTP